MKIVGLLSLMLALVFGADDSVQALDLTGTWVGLSYRKRNGRPFYAA